ncbi:hypothetical protein POSPLADRAFT_1138954 [Postia placenta MAD-698-R-SB12]|uniref:Uncharacterized protein n=1 Tax=Postia placenta MAD-698-R-SB12 TaxID=670580 RepID=A0A1X6N534_9APHY|nr:hypothetical protein POSPLADRAFT_1138954 [Postia placenta MAD-698-R-SB12]OSX63759.1 hypothetical protein POSPLADRAFT_1138954 [Postia placenta MAD-698-R-SB12]
MSASSFLTVRVSAFQHTPSSKASEGSPSAKGGREYLAIHTNRILTSLVCARQAYDVQRSSSTSRFQLLGSRFNRCSRQAVLRFGGALGERFGYGSSTVLLVSNSAVQRFSGSTFDGRVRSGPRQGSAIIQGRLRWLRPHPGKRVGSDGSGNILRRSGNQQSVNSDGMCTGFGDTASGGLQAAPRALLAMPVVLYYNRGLRSPATHAPELASLFLTVQVSTFQHPPVSAPHHCKKGVWGS